VKSLRVLASAFLACTVFGQSSSIWAQDVSLTLGTDYVSEYVFRNVTRSGEAFQPYVELSLDRFTVGAWGSLGIGDTDDVFPNEIDLYVSSNWQLTDFATAEIGATLYHFPQLGGLFDLGNEEGDGSTLEPYIGLDFDVLFSPSLTGFYDIQLETFTLEGALGYEFALIDNVTLDLGLKAGLVDSETDAVDYLYGQVSAKLFWDITERGGLFVGGHYGISSEDTFLDTDFDLSDPDTLSDPDEQSLWYSLGLFTRF